MDSFHLLDSAFQSLIQEYQLLKLIISHSFETTPNSQTTPRIHNHFTATDKKLQTAQQELHEFKKQHLAMLERKLSNNNPSLYCSSFKSANHTPLSLADVQDHSMQCVSDSNDSVHSSFTALPSSSPSPCSSSFQSISGGNYLHSSPSGSKVFSYINPQMFVDLQNTIQEKSTEEQIQFLSTVFTNYLNIKETTTKETTDSNTAAANSRYPTGI